MSNEEQINAKGRMVTDYLEAKTTLTSAEAELRHAAERLHAAAKAIAGAAADADLSVLEEAALVERLRRLIATANTARSRKQNLQSTLKSLGFGELE